MEIIIFVALVALNILSHEGSSKEDLKNQPKESIHLEKSVNECTHEMK